MDNNSNYIPRLIAFGFFDIKYTLILNKDDIQKYHVDINNIYSMDDLNFIVDNSELWERIDISSNNFILNTILNIIKFSEQCVYAEFVSFGYPNISNKSKKFENMLDDILKAHFISINKCNIITDGYSMSFSIIYDNEVKQIDLFNKNNEFDECFNEDDDKTKDILSDNSISIIKPDTKYNNISYVSSEYKFKEDNKIERINNNNNDKISINKKIASNKDMYSTLTVEEELKQIELDNKESKLNKIKLLCDKYEYLFMSIEDSIKIEPYSDFLELITFSKTKLYSNIIIHYTDISSYFLSEEKMIQLNRVYLLTDTYLINSDIASVLFSIHNEIFNRERNDKGILEIKNINEYFINHIACNGEICLINPKVLYTIDNYFNTLKICKIGHNGNPLSLSYCVRPYPQINKNNIAKINSYKRLILENYTNYESIFFGGILSQYIFQKNRKIFEILYSSYLAGFQILSKLLEYKYQCIPYPKDEDFYKIKLNKNHINSVIKKHEVENKETKFVLDCINTKKSSMKYYVPLFDKGLHKYFNKDIVRNELRKKGFINNNGYVNYDPYYRNEMVKVKNNNVISNVDKIKLKLFNDINNKEKFVNKKIVLDSIEPTKFKLPSDNINTCKSKYNKKKYNLNKCVHICHKKDCKSCYLKELGKQADLAEENKKKYLQLRRYE